MLASSRANSNDSFLALQGTRVMDAPNLLHTVQQYTHIEYDYIGMKHPAGSGCENMVSTCAHGSLFHCCCQNNDQKTLSYVRF